MPRQPYCYDEDYKQHSVSQEVFQPTEAYPSPTKRSYYTSHPVSYKALKDRHANNKHQHRSHQQRYELLCCLCERSTPL